MGELLGTWKALFTLRAHEILSLTVERVEALNRGVRNLGALVRSVTSQLRIEYRYCISGLGGNDRWWTFGAIHADTKVNLVLLCLLFSLRLACWQHRIQLIQIKLRSSMRPPL
jgi:hypothetical protein